VNPDAPLSRGFARVHRLEDGALVRQGASLTPGEGVRLVFADEARTAVIDGEARPAAPRPARSAKAPATPPAQGDLF
jgi:exonuclease VII large subunit